MLRKLYHRDPTHLVPRQTIWSALNRKGIKLSHGDHPSDSDPDEDGFDGDGGDPSDADHDGDSFDGDGGDADPDGDGFDSDC